MSAHLITGTAPGGQVRFYLENRKVNDGDELDLHVVAQPGAVATAARNLGYRPQGIRVRGRFSGPNARNKPQLRMALFSEEVAATLSRRDEDPDDWPTVLIELPPEALLSWPEVDR